MKKHYFRFGALGGGSGLLSCTCVVIPLVLFSVSASLAASIMMVLGSFDLLFIILGTSFFVSMISWDLKKKKLLNLKGIKEQKEVIFLSAIIFIGITSILILIIGPIFMPWLITPMS